MPTRASAKRYAQAIYQMAFEQDSIDRWGEDLKAFTEACEDPGLKNFLAHAKVPLARKVAAVKEGFTTSDPLVRNLLALLVSRGLVNLLPEVETEYRRLLDQYHGREHVEVLSAIALESSQVDGITRFLERLIKKQIELKSRVDPSILGGLVIRVGDRLIDGSTRSRLEALGQRLHKGGDGSAVIAAD